MAGEYNLKILLNHFNRYRKDNPSWETEDGTFIISGYVKEDNSIYIAQLAGVGTFFENVDFFTDYLDGSVLLFFCGEENPKVCNNKNLKEIIAEEVFNRTLLGKKTYSGFEDS